MNRSLVDISALDVCMQEQVALHGNIRDFSTVLWRQELDADGSNWNAHIARIRGASANDESWWGVVPQMRARYNLE
jgi:hypothetical protein